MLAALLFISNASEGGGLFFYRRSRGESRGAIKTNAFNSLHGVFAPFGVRRKKLSVPCASPALTRFA